MKRDSTIGPKRSADAADSEVSRACEDDQATIDELMDDLGCASDDRPVYRSNGYLDDSVRADQEESNDVLVASDLLFPQIAADFSSEDS